MVDPRLKLRVVGLVIRFVAAEWVALAAWGHMALHPTIKRHLQAWAWGRLPSPGPAHNPEGGAAGPCVITEWDG